MKEMVEPTLSCKMRCRIVFSIEICMADYKTQFADYSSEYLLEKRALGDELHPDAHKAIEEIMAERGEKIPKSKTLPEEVVVKRSPKKTNWISRNWVWLASIPVVVLLGRFVGSFAGSDGGFAGSLGWVKFIVVGVLFLGVWKYSKQFPDSAYVWLSGGTSFSRYTFSLGTTFTGTSTLGDFNGDGKTDLTFMNPERRPER